MLFLFPHKGACRHDGRCHDRDHEEKRRHDIIEHKGKYHLLHTSSIGRGQHIQQHLKIRSGIRGKSRCKYNDRRHNNGEHERHHKEHRENPLIRRNAADILFHHGELSGIHKSSRSFSAFSLSMRVKYISSSVIRSSDTWYTSPPASTILFTISGISLSALTSIS